MKIAIGQIRETRLVWAILLSLLLHILILTAYSPETYDSVASSVISQLKINLTSRPPQRIESAELVPEPDAVAIADETQVQNLPTVLDKEPANPVETVVPVYEPTSQDEIDSPPPAPVDTSTLKDFINESTDQGLLPVEPTNKVAERYKRTWNQRVEAIGQLNYPRDVARRQLTGKLTLRVAINSDGSLGSVYVEQSSGHDLLDMVAMSLVNESAPYEPLPANVPRINNQFVFTSSWEFRR